MNLENKLINICYIGDNLQILQFINRSDLPELVKTCKDLQQLCLKNYKKIPFYNWKLDEIPYNDDIFSALFTYSISKLNIILDNKLDINISKSYGYISNNGKIYDNNYKMKIINKLFNGFSLLEIAYLLNDQNLINILIDKKRTITRSIGSMSSLYSKKALKLSQLYSEKNIEHKLLQLLPKNPNTYIQDD